MTETDSSTLARIDENVKFIIKSIEEHKEVFKDHVIRDEEIFKEYIHPLWEESQQRKGATMANRVAAGLIGFMLTTGVAAVSAYATVKSVVSNAVAGK